MRGIDCCSGHADMGAGSLPLRTAGRFAADLALVVLLALAPGCSESTGPEPAPPRGPPGSDVTLPFPLDRGDEGSSTPGTYKGLWLRLVDNGAPLVTPVEGVIGVICIGMSNARQECDAFIAGVTGPWSGLVNPAVRVVNCAVGGHAVEKWIDASYDQELWEGCLTRKLPAAGLRADQVRVIYHKAANQFTLGSGGAALPLYPGAGSDYEAFHANLGQFADRVASWFPSVSAVYTSSRSYGGFSGNPGRGEPLSYEEGHALNAWLEANPSVDGVWYGWGAYLWAGDCAQSMTNASGVCYVRGDYVADGTHPSASGELKTSTMMHERLLEHAWYRR